MTWLESGDVNISDSTDQNFRSLSDKQFNSNSNNLFMLSLSSIIKNKTVLVRP